MTEKTAPPDIANGTQAVNPPETRLPQFYLYSLAIENFRSIERALFTFQPGLNVIIGANNAAKTAVVDALRIVLGLGSFEKKEDLIRLQATDVFTVAGDASLSAVSVSFTATFYGSVSSDLSSKFYDLVCNGDPVTVEKDGVKEEYVALKLRYRADFEFNHAKTRYEIARSELRGGTTLDNQVDHQALDGVRAIYLAPLRDLVSDGPRVGAEIERLILSHTLPGKEEDRKDIPNRLRQRAGELITEVTEDKHHVAAGKNLAQYAKPYAIGDDALSFVPAGISEGLFRSMRPVFAHALHGVAGLPLSSNGLGINQLIYASIVLSRQGDTDTDDGVHKVFLIEEPEAHLHPQLQDSFFHALNKITDHQVFVTSHSPTITAKTDVEKIIVMRRDNANRAATPLHLADAFRGQDSDKSYLHKFLDVTRSQLLFAKGAVFVEGVTEAMLLQVFSDIMGRSLRDHAIEVVVVDSNSGFDHFRPLFQHGDGTYTRAVFITDGDEDPSQVKTDDEFRNDTNGLLDVGLEPDGNIATATGYGTFEFGLLRTAIVDGGKPEMQEILKAALRAATPSDVTGEDALDNFVHDFMDFEHPSLAYKRMKEKKKGTYLKNESDWHGTRHTNDQFRKAKSEFAYRLYEALTKLPLAQASQQFTVPKYIRDAIEFVLGGATTSGA